MCVCVCVAAGCSSTHKVVLGWRVCVCVLQLAVAVLTRLC